MQYNFNWDRLTPTDFMLYQERMEREDYNWDILGQVRVGTLCFDFVIRDGMGENRDEIVLVADCYVGGIPGYDFSTIIPDYPYNEADGFCFSDLCTEYSYDEFKRMAEEAMTNFINAPSDPDIYRLREKALEPLTIW